jgi:hypothetical protein
MPCHRLRSTACAAVLLLCTVLPAHGQIDEEWGRPTAGVLAIGNMTDAPGLEALVPDDPTGGEVNPTTRAISLWRAEDYGTLPSPFDLYTETTYWLRDVDGDGFAEIIGLVPVNNLQGTPGSLGILDVSAFAPRFSFKWTPIQGIGVEPNLEFIQLNAQEPSALVNWGRYVRIHSSVTGNLLYDSEVSIGSNWRVNSVLVDDLDGDGAEEVLVSFFDAPNAYQLVMIGDRSVRTSAEPSSISSQILMQSRPNPASGSTVIAYTLPQSGRVRLRVFDTAGREVRTLVDEWTAAGSYTRQWNGKDDAGVAVASGIYFYELDVDGQRQTQKVVQIR